MTKPSIPEIMPLIATPSLLLLLPEEALLLEEEVLLEELLLLEEALLEEVLLLEEALLLEELLLLEEALLREDELPASRLLVPVPLSHEKSATHSAKEIKVLD